MNLSSSGTVALSAAASIASLLSVYWLVESSRVRRDKYTPTHFFSRLFLQKPSLSRLKDVVSKTTSTSSYRLASAIIKDIPIYDCSKLDISYEVIRQSLQDEWYHILLQGPGVLVLKNMYPDATVIDTSNGAFASIIAHEKAQDNAHKGDHFSPGSNDRIWNSFSKHCLQDPSSFLTYYSNPFLALICDAYLGPAYRVTAQVNIVKPGGAPQVCHRDYHLGFQSMEQAAKWPRAMHAASQLLTLQGAIAQTHMPLDSGPTRLLPFSQLLEDGYLACRLPEFNEFFLENFVSVPLQKGDGLFFNPALFHAAGQNETTDLNRSANLLQISSAFGRPMETVDSFPLVERSWGKLSEKYDREGWSAEVDAFVRAIADGYPFPTNLDRRPPSSGGMAPESEQEVVERLLKRRATTEEVMQKLRQMKQDSTA